MAELFWKIVVVGAGCWVVACAPLLIVWAVVAFANWRNRKWAEDFPRVFSESFHKASREHLAEIEAEEGR